MSQSLGILSQRKLSGESLGVKGQEDVSALVQVDHAFDAHLYCVYL